jgi:hypothetical protein
MQILGMLGMYFDAVVVEVKKNLLLFRLALAILCGQVVMPSILPKTGWAIAHPAHPPVTPLI